MPGADPKAIRMLVLDVDGVLTDGTINLDDASNEIKRFNIRDGFGIRMWQAFGGQVAICTGRTGIAITRRARELAIEHVIQGSGDKGASIAKLAEESGIAAEAMAYIGDDWPDLPAMRAVGLPIAVADAEPLVREHADRVTERSGGRGAVREVVEWLLEARGKLDEARQRYLA